MNAKHRLTRRQLRRLNIAANSALIGLYLGWYISPMLWERLHRVDWRVRLNPSSLRSDDSNRRILRDANDVQAVVLTNATAFTDSTNVLVYDWPANDPRWLPPTNNVRLLIVPKDGDWDNWSPENIALWANAGIRTVQSVRTNLEGYGESWWTRIDFKEGTP